MTDQQEASPGQPVAAKAPNGPRRRHRTARHVAIHGTAASGVSAAAAIVHAFGLAGLAATAGTTIVVAGGRYALKRGAVKKPALSRPSRPAPRLRDRPRGAATGGRATAGLRRDSATAARRTGKPGATGSGARRKGATGGSATAAPSRRSAGLRRHPGATPRRATGSKPAAPKAARPSSPKPTARGGATARPRSAGGASPRTAKAVTPPGAKQRAATPAKPTQRRAGATTRPTSPTRIPRGAERRATAGRAATRRPAARPTAGARQRQSQRQSQRSTLTRRRAVRAVNRHAIRHAARAAQFARTGVKASLPYLRLRPPVEERQAAAKKTAPKKTAAQTPATKATANATTAVRPKKTAVAAAQPAIRPGRAIGAPGLTPKDIMDTSAPSVGITAAADAITEHIAAFEPQNMLEVGAFIDGIEHLLTTLGTSLITVADKFGGDNPVDSNVVDQIQQLGAHAIELGQWGPATSALFRAAHAAELERIHQPRPNEEAWDVQNNR